MKTTRTLILLCGAMIAVGTLAAQSTAQPYSGQQSQPQTQAPQTQPAPQTPQQQPGQPSQQPESKGQMPPGHPTIDDQVSMLTQDLGLTPEQQTKMRTILEDQHKQAMSIVDDPSMARDDKIQKIRALREATIDKTRAMLTDEQKKKLDDMLNEPAQPRSGQPSTGAPPSGAKPQPSPPPENKPPDF